MKVQIIQMIQEADGTQIECIYEFIKAFPDIS